MASSPMTDSTALLNALAPEIQSRAPRDGISRTRRVSRTASYLTTACASGSLITHGYRCWGYHDPISGVVTACRMAYTYRV